MPHHKSAEKRVRTSAAANIRNTAVRSRMRAAIKSVRQAQTKAEGLAAYRTATAVLDRTAAKGIIKKEMANRQKARLARHAGKLPA